MEVERTMEFILQNLASVTAKQEKAEGEIESLRKLAKVGMKLLVKVQESHKELQKEFRESHRMLETKTAELAESQRRTDEKFQRWLDTRNGSNGHEKPN
jgi:predicted HicB family RNase H-like nuclease